MGIDRLHFRGDDVPDLAILILLTESGTHTGLLYRFELQLYVLDLLWHERFRVAPTRNDHHFVVPDLLEEEVIEVAAACQLIVLRRRQRGPQLLKYGFGLPKDPIVNRDGEILFGGSVGLTCATLVLAIFEAVRIPFVDYADWVARPEDDARHRRLLGMIRTGIPGQIPPADAAHIDKMEKELPCIRVRPEEVAAIGLCDQRPAKLSQVEPIGKLIIKLISDKN